MVDGHSCNEPSFDLDSGDENPGLKIVQLHIEPSLQPLA